MKKYIKKTVSLLGIIGLFFIIGYTNSLAKDSKSCVCDKKSNIKKILFKKQNVKNFNFKTLLYKVSIGPQRCNGKLVGIILRKFGKDSIFNYYNLKKGSVLCAFNGVQISKISKIKFYYIFMKINSSFNKKKKVELSFYIPE